MDNLLEPLLSQSVSTTSDIDRYLSDVQRCILDAMHNAVPIVKHCAFKRPYWDSDLKEAHAKQKYLRLLWAREGRPRGIRV